MWRPRLLSVCNQNRHAHSARTREGLRKKIMHRVASRGVDPRVKFLDDANAIHSRSFEHTPTPLPCRPYASSSFAKLRAIESLADETYSSSAFVSLQIPIDLHRIQPTHFLQQALHGECVDCYRNKREEQDSNSFSTSGTSQQRLHVTCPQTYLYTTVSCPYGRAMYTSLIYKAQIVCLCVCLCSRLASTSFVRSQPKSARTLGTHRGRFA